MARCVFCNFLKSGAKHSNGFPFLPIHETKHSISFLSVDFPDKEDGHTLVIPKIHGRAIYDLPKAVQHDLMEHVALMSRILRKRHGGCNILLNDGKHAGQTVMHAHFHLVPRDEGDKIKIEVWRRKEMEEESFQYLTEVMRTEVSKMRRRGL